MAMATVRLYIHWPFCVSKCPYCDFNSHVRDSIDQQTWREALLADLAHEAALLPGRRLTSIFFGGGTPSLMDPATAEALIAAARRHWPAADDIEITLEANPSSVEAARFADLAAAGSTASALASSRSTTLRSRFLGRAHSASEGLAALDVAQANFDRVTFDLIYALPGQVRGRLASDADPRAGARHRAPLAVPTDHRARHPLRRAACRGQARSHRCRHRRRPLRNDRGDDRRGRAAALRDQQSCPAREESRHNLTYWRYGDYAGIGPGAHGRRLGTRTVRHSKPENFLVRLCPQRSRHRRGSALVADRVGRRSAGHGSSPRGRNRPWRLASRFGLDHLLDERAVARLVASGHLAWSGKRLRTTPAGRLLLDHILGQIADAQPPSAVMRSA